MSVATESRALFLGSTFVRDKLGTNFSIAPASNEVTDKTTGEIYAIRGAGAYKVHKGYKQFDTPNIRVISCTYIVLIDTEFKLMWVVPKADLIKLSKLNSANNYSLNIHTPEIEFNHHENYHTRETMEKYMYDLADVKTIVDRLDSLKFSADSHAKAEMEARSEILQRSVSTFTTCNTLFSLIDKTLADNDMKEDGILRELVATVSKLNKKLEISNQKLLDVNNARRAELGYVEV
ncbi:MAG: hypothetical protein DRH08_09250 [Deltaproteobacteria bacterium]|nr:MAG: hypothetical protein DRH08_09250 [Deltaproteobacteria bacterium]